MSRYHDPDGAGYYDGPADHAAGERQGARAGYRPGEDRDARGQRTARAGTAARGRQSRPRRRGGLATLGHRPILSVIAIIATVAVTGIALTAYAAYRGVYDSIHHVNVTNAMLGKRPPKLNGSLNVLMIGSDSRAGLHGKFGRGIFGARSDTTMLLHISPTHSHVFVISFPRDSMVPIYSCQAGGKAFPGQSAQQGVERLNATFSAGGPACLWKTLEQTTRIHIDHFMEVDFTGFRKIVNDLGGVNVCLPFAINDPASGLHLTKGPHLIRGAQALAFVRERHIGLGSDLQRIQRQQLFLASVAQKVKSSGILTNLPKLYTLVHDVASSLTTDSGLTVTDLYAIANSLRNLSTKSLRFISVPVVPYPVDPAAEVQWAMPASGQLFTAIAEDNAIAKAAKNAAKAAKAAAPHPGPTVSPAHVQLDVLNGTNIAGLAAKTASKLTANRFSITGTGNANTANYQATYIEYTSKSQLAQADTLANEVPGAQVKRVPRLLPGVPAGSIALVLGSSFKGLAGSHAAAKKSNPPGAALANNYGGISGNANICKDSGAFAGPDTPSMFGG